MSKKIVTASLVVSFATGSSAEGGSELKLELDESRNGEESSFGVEDAVFVRLIKSSDVELANILCTSGSLSSIVNGETVAKEDQVSFTNSAETNLSYPSTGTGTVAWMGDPVVVATAQVGQHTEPGLVATFHEGKSVVKVPKKVVAIGKASYNTRADIYKLSGVGDVESVLIYADGSVA